MNSHPAKQSLLHLALVCLSALATLSCTPACAQSQPAIPLHVVRVGFGNVAAMKQGITAAVEACQIAKHLPASAPTLPSDSYLSTLAVSEEDEYFDGPHWAVYKTERSIGPDAASSCGLRLFSHRSADIELTCESRIRGNTTLMGELQDLEDPKASVVTIDDQVLPSRPCQETHPAMDLTGLPRFNAGAAQCVWTGDYMAKALSKLGVATAPGPAQGFDTCVYAEQPKYFYKGSSRPVVLATRVQDDSGQEARINAIFGEAHAFGNQSLKAFSVGKALDASVFTRSHLQSFLALPAKTNPGSN